MPNHRKNCTSSYNDRLIKLAPDVLWYDLQDVGSYQGTVYGIGEYKGKVIIYTDYYGSCSGCGAWYDDDSWGRDAGPKSFEDIWVRSNIVDMQIAQVLVERFEDSDKDRQLAAIFAIAADVEKRNV